MQAVCDICVKPHTFSNFSVTLTPTHPIASKPDTPHYSIMEEIPYRILNSYGREATDGTVKILVSVREPASRTISSWEYKYNSESYVCSFLRGWEGFLQYDKREHLTDGKFLNLLRSRLRLPAPPVAGFALRLIHSSSLWYTFDRRRRPYIRPLVIDHLSPVPPLCLHADGNSDAYSLP